MKLRNFRTFFALSATLLFIVCFAVWKSSEKRVYSINVNIPRAFDPNFTDAEIWEYIKSGNSLPILEMEKRKMLIPNYDKFLVISLDNDKTLKINLQEIGNLKDTKPLTDTLSRVFAEREEARVFETNSNKIVKAVIISAPRSAKYGEVVRVVDAVKSSGADPVILQIDDLPE